MATNIAQARLIRDTQIKALYSKTTRDEAEKLKALGAEVNVTFGSASPKESLLVKEIRQELDRHERLIADLKNGIASRDVAYRILALAEAHFSSEHPEAARIIRDTAMAEESVRSTIRSLGDLGDDTPNAYDGSESNATLHKRKNSKNGVRFAELEYRDAPAHLVALIDNPAWSDDGGLVRLRPSPEGPYRADIEDSGVVLIAPDQPVVTNREIEANLDNQFANIMHKHDDYGLWVEDSITQDIVIALRDGKEPKTFAYQVGKRWVAVRLRIFPQRGRDSEQRLGDLCLIVEQLNKSRDGLARVGVAAVEAKKRHYRRNALHALRPEQAERILANAPKTRLVVYDARAQMGWHAACIALRDYSSLQTGAVSDVLKRTGVRFSEQLTQRFFLGRNLDFDPAAVKRAEDNYDKFTFSGYSAVAVSDNREMALLAAQQQTELELRLISTFERYLRRDERTISKSAEHDLSTERKASREAKLEPKHESDLERHLGPEQGSSRESGSETQQDLSKELKGPTIERDGPSLRM